MVKVQFTEARDFNIKQLNSHSISQVLSVSYKKKLSNLSYCSQ